MLVKGWGEGVCLLVRGGLVGLVGRGSEGG